MSGEDVETDHSGAILGRTRESLSYSLREVSEALHLPIHTIDAIERGDKARLPSYVFTQGYVRAYARLLELDPDPLLKNLRMEYGEATLSESDPEPALDLPFTPAQVRLLIPWVGAGLAILIVLGIMFTMMGGDDVSDPSEDWVEAADAVEAASVGVPAVVEVTEVTEVTEMTDPVDRQPDAATEAIVGAQQVELVAEDGGRQLTPGGDDRLELMFSEECWLEIRDLDDRLLYGNLGRPGEPLEFTGQGPFRLLLGYAPGATLMFNGEPVVLGPHTRNNVANLVIGQ